MELSEKTRLLHNFLIYANEPQYYSKKPSLIDQILIDKNLICIEKLEGAHHGFRQGLYRVDMTSEGRKYYEEMAKDLCTKFGLGD